MLWMILTGVLSLLTHVNGENFNINTLKAQWMKSPALDDTDIHHLLQGPGKDVADVLSSKLLKAHFLQNPTHSLMRNLLIQNKDAILSNTEGQCLLDSLKFVIDLSNFTLYSIIAVDSYGRPEAGGFSGNTRWLGEFDQCTWNDFQTSALTKFKGKYCSVHFTYDLGGSTTFRAGVCIPDSCEAPVAALYANVLLPGLGVAGPDIVFTSCFEERQYSAGDIAALVILSLFCLLCLLGTLLDVLIRNDRVRARLVMKLVLSFSWITNGRKLLSAKAASGQLSCLNGLRTISMFWVILGHAAFFPLIWTHNIVSVLLRIFPTFEFQGIVNADFSVDTFFFLSGLLVSYLALKAFTKHSPLRPKFWGLFYFHRFWRLTPVYMLCLMFWTTLFLHIPKGPRARDFDGITGPCEYWWTNLLYINNFHPNKGDNAMTCFGWAWYLANDMQFFILSPIFLLLLHYLWVAGLVLCLLLILACVIATGVLADQYQIYPDHPFTVDGSREMEMLMYNRPYFRYIPYLIGLIIGWTAIKYKNGVKMPWFVAVIGWVFTAGSCMALIYGLLPYRDGSATWNIDLGITYTAMKRLTWSVGVAWVTFACLNGYGGPVNWFLSWKIWIPLGRLTYCAYLVHPLFMYAYLLNLKQDFHMDAQGIAEFFVVSIVCSYALAVVVSLTLESPFMALEKLFLGGSRPSVKPSTPQDENTTADEIKPQPKMGHVDAPYMYINDGYTGPHHHHPMNLTPSNSVAIEPVMLNGNANHLLKDAAMTDENVKL